MNPTCQNSLSKNLQRLIRRLIAMQCQGVMCCNAGLSCSFFVMQPKKFCGKNKDLQELSSYYCLFLLDLEVLVSREPRVQDLKHLLVCQLVCQSASPPACSAAWWPSCALYSCHFHHRGPGHLLVGAACSTLYTLPPLVYTAHTVKRCFSILSC